MISTAEFRNGARMELEGTPYYIVEFQHVKPGKGGAFVRTKLKNLKTGQVLEKTFRSGEKFDEPDLEECEMQFLYSTGDSYTFMDTSSYEQFSYQKDQLGDDTDLLKENATVEILLYEGSPISMILPTFMELEVVETDLDMFDATTSDEVFLTSTSLCICPVRKVQGSTVGDGNVPGPVTKALMDAYVDLVDFDWVGQYLKRLED